ncbi:MAG: hypothetical protein LBD93_02935 [Treponema sp.]|jgi:hypothetical protein|nr:hypothetical protein [Treponema sp.]
MWQNHSHTATGALNLAASKSGVQFAINPYIIAWVCIGIYTAAIGFSGFRFYTGIRDRRILAEKEFFNLADVSTTEASNGFMTELFKEKILNALETSKTLQGVILSAGPAGNYTFERFKGATVRWTGDVPHFRTQFGISKKPFIEGLQIPNMRNVYISAVYNTIDYSRIITILKHTLFVITAAFGIACLTFILQFFPARVSYPPSVKPSSKPKPGGAYAKKAPLPAHKGKPKEEPIKEARDTSFTLHSEAEQAAKTGASVAAPPPSAEEIHDLCSKGIGEESGIRDRLSSELHRCAFFEQDMVFMIMALKSKAQMDILYPLLIDEVIHFFILPDLIFEKNPWGIALILPDITLDQGLAKSGEFHQQVLGKYPEFSRNQGNLYIGMSSRAGRFINAERLMLEAGQALEKAQEDASAPIVAFRSDPEKYRAFMASQNTKPS